MCAFFSTSRISRLPPLLLSLSFSLSPSLSHPPPPTQSLSLLFLFLPFPDHVIIQEEDARILGLVHSVNPLSLRLLCGREHPRRCWLLLFFWRTICPPHWLLCWFCLLLCRLLQGEPLTHTITHVAPPYSPTHFFFFPLSLPLSVSSLSLSLSLSFSPHRMAGARWCRMRTESV